jgi:hypothetical protein
VNICKNTFIDLSPLTDYLLSFLSGNIEKTVVLHDSRSINRALLGFYAKANTRYDCCGVTSEPTPLESKKISETLLNLKNQNVSLRQITEITKDNISYCKLLMKIAVAAWMELNAKSN